MVSLELDDAPVGWLMATDGGRVDVGPWLRAKEAAALVHPGPGLWDWVEGSLYGERRRGALLAFDAEGQELERLMFAGATLTELGAPALREGGEGPGALNLRLRVGAAEVVGGGEARAQGLAPARRIARCRLQIAGEPARALAAIGPLTVRLFPRAKGSLQRVMLTWAGEPWADAEALVDRAGRLEYLADGEAEEVVAALEFEVAGASAEASGAAGARRVRAELVCDGLRFVAPGA